MIRPITDLDVQILPTPSASLAPDYVSAEV